MEKKDTTNNTNEQQTVVVASRADAEKVAARIRRNAKQRASLQAEYETAVLAVNNDFGVKLQKLATKIEADVTALSAWAVGHPEEFSAGKTLTLSGVEICYRDGVPAVQILDKWDEAEVIASLSEAGKTRWIRVKKTLEKRVILADYKKGETDAKELKKFGLAVASKPSVTVNVQNAVAAA